MSAPTRPGLARQPDDPGVDYDEFAQVVFKPSLAGRKTAWLGFIRLGEIIQAGWDQLRQARARIDLPNAPRKLIAADVREWTIAAGVRHG